MQYLDQSHLSDYVRAAFVVYNDFLDNCLLKYNAFLTGWTAILIIHAIIGKSLAVFPGVKSHLHVYDLSHPKLLTFATRRQETFETVSFH